MIPSPVAAAVRRPQLNLPSQSEPRHLGGYARKENRV